MRLALLTNMPSQHQSDLGAELASILGQDNFRLVFAEPTSDARQEMGWDDAFSEPYILRMWESQAAQQEVQQWIEQADVVVQGRFPMALVKNRIKAGKLTFAYQERFWKRPFNLFRLIARLPRIYQRYWSVNKPNYHLLAAGAYVASDLAKIGMFKNRAWKFGYFLPASKSQPAEKNNESLQLLWCARFAPVKRVQDAFQIVRELLKLGVDCQLTLIGDGELRSQAEEWSADITDQVEFLGWQPKNKVAEEMRKADIFLMTSGFGEGWGMVINEAQAAGCMVVANQDVGAAPWLIEHGKSGLLYQQAELANVAKEIANLSREHRVSMGQNGKKIHDQFWCVSVVAQRLVGLSRDLLFHSGKDIKTKHQDGPCAAAR